MMKTPFAKGNGILFMKIGVHAQEPIEVILERKREELRRAGVSFWGYGGATCHPFKMVQPFAREVESTGHDVYLVMHKMDSRHFAEPKPATQYSDDGMKWKDIPNGVRVLGSRYALVLSDLDDVNSELDLGGVEVAVGPSRGRRGADYIKGQVDKGCFRLSDSPEGARTASTKHIDLVAKLREPFAVIVR